MPYFLLHLSSFKDQISQLLPWINFIMILNKFFKKRQQIQKQLQRFERFSKTEKQKKMYLAIQLKAIVICHGYESMKNEINFGKFNFDFQLFCQIRRQEPVTLMEHFFQHVKDAFSWDLPSK